MDAITPTWQQLDYQLQAFDSAYRTSLGSFVVANCLGVLRSLPAGSVDLVITSPPYDGQPKYGNGETYERDWYSGFFLDVTHEIYRILRPHGSFVLN